MSQLQNNPFQYSNTNKRYYTWDYYLKQRFGEKVAKISLNAGFSCPHINKNEGGCTFCSIHGSGDFAGFPGDEITKQFHDVKQRMLLKWPNTNKFIAYFQAWTNTFAPLHILKEKFEPFVTMDGVVGISIATRPDCLSTATLDYLETLSARTFIIVELGLQTIHAQTSNYINRGHDLKIFNEAIVKLAKRNIPICVHIINGLPFETREMMLETALFVSKLPVKFLKIHMLHVMRFTEMEKQLKQDQFTLLTQDEFVEITIKQLEIMPQSMVIQRLTGDAPRDLLIAPTWTLNKIDVLNAIDKSFVLQNTYQGKLHKENLEENDEI